MNTKILDMTVELGNAIKNSEEMENMNKTEEAMLNNNGAKALMDEYRSMHGEFMSEHEKGSDRQTIEAKHMALLEKQNEIENNNITKEFLDASNAFNELIQKVNAILVETIRGEDSCSSDDCSSCSGCR